ncbi:MAG TPA: glycosyltransferase, partial [Thermoplasmata archaeon]|nr:glycosyltransferase [Thermoplasmata archaeon]
MEAHGHRVFTFAPEDPNNGHHVERDTIFSRAKEFRPYPGYRLAIFPGHEIEALNDLDVDLIHSHGIGFMGIKGLWCSWASRIPIVQTYHTLVQEAIPFYSPLGLNLHLLERG